MNPDHRELDILHHVESLTEKMNMLMAERSQSAIKRYPLTFTLVGLVGAVAVTEGLKGLLDEIGYVHSHPSVLLVGGLVILAALGSLYHIKAEA